MNPVWTNVFESSEAKRLKQLLPDEGSFFAIETEEGTKPPSHSRLIFPLLQPIKAAQIPGKASSQVELDSWSKSYGAIVVQVRFLDVINRLPGFDDVLGEVALPISKIIENGEIHGWFQVLDVGTTHALPVSGTEEQGPVGNETPLIYLCIKWQKPKEGIGITDTDREGSIVVAQELVRSAIKASANKLDLIGSSVGAFNKVWGLGGNIQTVQNALGGLLDFVERFRNALNFTVCLELNFYALFFFSISIFVS
jgi:hypothetical protein